MRGRFNIARIRQNLSYTVQDVCHLYGIHKNTVREWFRQGLPKIDIQRPCLIHGGDLKTFLAARQKSRRKKCALPEFYCFRCRVPRTAFGNLVDLAPRTEKTVMLSGLCQICETPLHKLQSVKLIPKILQTFDISTQQEVHIRESLLPSLNCYLEKERER